MTDPLTVGFATSAQNAFAFLERRGFRCLEVSPYKVRFESARVVVIVSLGERDGEVAIHFGRLGMDECFSFVTFLRHNNPVLDATLGYRIAFNTEQRDSLLRQLAKSLLSDGREVLDAKDSAFDRMVDLKA